MEEKPISNNSMLTEAISMIEAEVREGVVHGYFKFAIKCKVGHGGKRELIVEAGKNHRFLIPKEELQQSA